MCVAICESLPAALTHFVCHPLLTTAKCPCSCPSGHLACIGDLSPSLSLQILIFSMFLLASCLLLGNGFTSSDSEGWQKGELRSKREAWRGEQEQAGLFTQAIGEAETKVVLLTKADCIGLGLMALLELYSTMVHTHLLPNLAFLPLMLTSIVCAVGLLWVWFSLWMSCCWQNRQRKDD